MRTSPFFALFLGVVFTFGMLLLIVELWQLQVTEVAGFREGQQRQATRRICVPGMRGRILDCRGRVLADSRPNRAVVCRPEWFLRRGNVSNTVNAVCRELDRLAALLGCPRTVTADQIARHLREAGALPLVAASDLDDRALARFAEHFEDFPGFDEEVRAERVYPYGSLAAHLLGYVGHDRPDDVAGANSHYWEPDMRGRAGLELFYNGYLAGVAGERQVHVTARGFKPPTDDGEDVRAPSDGLDLHLTLDASIQNTLERQLRGCIGAGVVLDPRTGAVLALASAPTYNLNAFVPVLASERYRALADDPGHPLLNRALSGTYAPGSTFKPITAVAALNAGQNPEKLYDCTGVFTLGAFRLHCWDRYGHGEINLHRAIRESCNAYFCNLGRETGSNAVIRAARDFGLGTKTGIDVPGEAAGVVPDAAWKRAHYGEAWYPGDICQMSIGQGMLLVTPLQMAVACAALANGGDVYAPYLRARTEGMPPPRPIRHVTSRPADFARVRAGMRAVADGGTGKRVQIRFGENRVKYTLKVAAAAKTGTAEVGRGETRRKNTWVIAFAPYEHPTVAVAMVIERGESGGLTTAPKVHEVLAGIFEEEVL